MTIRHLTYTLTYARQCDKAEIVAFFERCIGHDWVNAQYLSPRAHIGGLAGAVMSVVIHESEQVRFCFQLPSLLVRLWRDIPKGGSDAEKMGSWLQLLGAALLLGRPSSIPSVQPFGSAAIADALTHYAPRPEAKSIEFIQSNLWVGLREWCRLSGEQIIVETELAETILSQFKNAEPEQSRARMLNTLMIEWLESSKANGWRLSVEKIPLQVALDGLEKQKPIPPTPLGPA
jgi:hypothetical protein